jgi:holo-[acyl-carrier protein] synthase
LPHFAARFAAKEAVAKAFGTGIGEHAAFREIEVIRSASGAPGIRLHGAAAAFAATQSLGEIFLSLSHTDSHAIAYVIVLGACCPTSSGSSAFIPM